MNGFKGLIFWYLNVKRALPWRDTRDPYRVWISEIVLQQTRVEQGLEYYLRFINTYPNVFELAAAQESDVLKLWQGLGYYSRARNLHYTARHIVHELNGIFPETYKDILMLRGVGPYTAAAIASFAYRLPHAAVDGNVSRVLSRVYDIDEPINSTTGVKNINELADLALDRKRPDLHNQAMIELGATVCAPRKPRCGECPISGICMARQRGTIGERPVKMAAKKPQPRYMDYAVIETEKALVFRKRTGDDIWKGLHDFAAVEGYRDIEPSRVANFVAESFPESKIEYAPGAPEISMTHMLSHRRIEARFWRFGLSGPIEHNFLYLSVDKNEIEKLAVPRPIERYLQEAEWI